MNDEIRLILKVQRSGDRVAADTLIRNYYDEIYRYVFRQTANKDDALDLTQSIFISMLTTIHFYDRKKAGFRTWLYKIATNKTIDFFRSRTIQSNHTLDINELELPDEHDFVRQIEASDLLEKVRECVNILPTETQQIFRLKFYGGYTFEQISSILTMPESSVKSRYYRLLNHLRKEFRDEYD